MTIFGGQQILLHATTGMQFLEHFYYASFDGSKSKDIFTLEVRPCMLGLKSYHSHVGEENLLQAVFTVDPLINCPFIAENKGTT